MIHKQAVKPALSLILTLSAALLTACGGGGGGGGGAGENAGSATETGLSSESTSADTNITSASGSTEQAAAVAASTIASAPESRQEAARFLTQATFGPSDDTVSDLVKVGYSTWFQNQAAAPVKLGYKAYWDQRNTLIKQLRPQSGAGINELNHVFWTNAVARDSHDQLRQRIAYALSEIFVVSVKDGCAENNMSGTASYYDTLVDKALGNYRDLLKAVTLHPIMGCYLSYLKNQGEDAVTGRVPDENYAREVMQLFSIGLIKLNKDGTPVIGSNGQPVETYTPADIAGLAKVFTGWSWDCPGYPADNCFIWGTTQGQSYADRWARPMRPYAKFHSKSEKKFLSVTVPATATPDTALNTALDTLANHPNVGPFIGKQLIQRLVTSNPSPDYVRRVSAAFDASGGNLLATVKAILLDPEARSATLAASPTFGKVREPVLRMSALLRAFFAESATDRFLQWSTDDAGAALGQSVVEAPSVFNYFRPSYVPAGSATAAAKLVAPELQIFHETSVAGYVNFMRDGLWQGFGMRGYNNVKEMQPDILMEYHTNPNSVAMKAAATSPAALVELVNQRLLYGKMSTALRNEVTQAVTATYVTSASGQTAADILETRKRRVMVAALLTVASPEFLIQR